MDEYLALKDNAVVGSGESATACITDALDLHNISLDDIQSGSVYVFHQEGAAVISVAVD